MNKRSLLSNLWLFATINYLFCDLVGLMDATMLNQYLTGNVGGMTLSSSFLLGASMLMEVPIIMILLSRLMDYKWNRRLNLVSGSLMTLVQVATLFMGKPTNYFLFFSSIEITTTLFIVYTSCNWEEDTSSRQI